MWIRYRKKIWTLWAVILVRWVVSRLVIRWVVSRLVIRLVTRICNRSSLIVRTYSRVLIVIQIYSNRVTVQTIMSISIMFHLSNSRWANLMKTISLGYQIVNSLIISSKKVRIVIRRLTKGVIRRARTRYKRVTKGVIRKVTKRVVRRARTKYKRVTINHKRVNKRVKIKHKEVKIKHRKAKHRRVKHRRVKHRRVRRSIKWVPEVVRRWWRVKEMII